MADTPGRQGAAVNAPPWRADERLARLEWTVLKRLDGILQGDWRTLFRGHGLDLAELREYQHHDDVRRIDWNVTARVGQPFVREYLEDREAAAWFLLDLSASVDFGTVARKRSVAADITGVLASALARKGHRVGALVDGGAGVDTALPARGGRRQVLALLERMAPRAALKLVKPGPSTSEKASRESSGKATASARSSAALAGTTQLDALLRAARQTVRGRSVIFVVSDFISQPGWEAPLADLAARHDVVAIRIVDPAERTMPDLGLIPMVDAESGASLMVDTGSARFRERYARLAAEREAQVQQSLAGAGVDTLELTTGDDLAAALLRFIHARRDRARLNAGAMAWHRHHRAPNPMQASQPRKATP